MCRSSCCRAGRALLLALPTLRCTGYTGSCCRAIGPLCADIDNSRCRTIRAFPRWLPLGTTAGDCGATGAAATPQAAAAPATPALAAAVAAAVPAAVRNLHLPSSSPPPRAPPRGACRPPRTPPLRGCTLCRRAPPHRRLPRARRATAAAVAVATREQALLRWHSTMSK